MWQLCPTCTMLSNLVPSPIDVTPSAARSTHEFAPISTKSAISTRPTSGNFGHPSLGLLGKPGPPFRFQPGARPLRPHPGSRVQHAPPTDIHVVVYRHVGVQHAAFAQRHPLAHHAEIGRASCRERV